MNISDLLTAIFKHPNFYSDKAKTGLISTPVEYVARLLRFTGIQMTQNENLQTMYAMNDMGMELLIPPNVAGWKQNSYWLSTTGLGARGLAAANLFYTTGSQTLLADCVTISDPVAAVTAAGRKVGLVSLNPDTLSALTTWLKNEKTRSGSTTAFQSAGLLHMLFISPDFQLS